MENVPAWSHHVHPPSKYPRHAHVFFPSLDDRHLKQLSADCTIDGPRNAATGPRLIPLIAAPPTIMARTVFRVQPDGQGPSLDVVFPQHRVIVPRIRRPVFGDAESRADDILRGQHEDLQPDPEAEHQKGMRFSPSEQEIVCVEPEIRQGSQAEDGLADDKLPFEGAAAVADNIPVYLRNPHG